MPPPPAEATASASTSALSSSGSASTMASHTTPSPSTTVPPPATRLSFPRRVLAAYLRQLGARPLRTKMITSTFLFFMGDTIAQLGIEGRRIPLLGAPVEPPVDVDGKGKEREERDPDAEWDPVRAARLMFYGGTIFAPLAHNWLNLLQKVQLGSKFKTITARVAVDQLVWGPFIVCLFWTCNGILEGKSIPEVKEKVQLAFLPVYQKSLMVFGPTAAISFTFVPLQHRLLVGQSVGLGWNTYLSYLNHVNNKRLAAAADAVSKAEAAELANAGERGEAAAELAHKKSELALEKARVRREKILASQGGGSTGVGTRMGH